MNDFRVHDLLYKGDVSDTWHGVHTATNKDVFVLHVNKKSNTFDQTRFEQLETVVGRVVHPHILNYFKVLQNDTTIGVIMEHPMGCTLRDYLVQQPGMRLSESETRKYFVQILSGVECLHSLSIVHRNLNLRNIFIDRNDSIKLGDYLICPKLGPIYKQTQMSATASYHFFAPETWLDEETPVDCPADIWSLGILLYVMVCGYYPFNGRDEFNIFLSIKRGHFSMPNYLSDECASLLKALLVLEPPKRLSAEAIKSHPWIRAPVLPQNGSPPPLSFTPIPTPSQIPTRGRMTLGVIPETDEIERPSSQPVSTLQSRLQDLSLRFERSNSPSPGNSVGPAMSIAEAEATLISPTDEEEKKGRRKRTNPTNSTDPVHTLIANYFKAKSMGTTSSHVSTYLPTPGTPPAPVASEAPEYTPPMGTVGPEGKPPRKRRNSADSILQSEEVQRLLRTNGEEPTNQNRTSPPIPPGRALGTTPPTPSIGTDIMRRNTKSGSTGRKGRRRKSFEAPSLTNKLFTPPPDSSSLSIPNFENISLFQPMGGGEPSPRATHSRSLSANTILWQSEMAHDRNLQAYQQQQRQEHPPSSSVSSPQVEFHDQEKLEELLQGYSNSGQQSIQSVHTDLKSLEDALLDDNSQEWEGWLSV